MKFLLDIPVFLSLAYWIWGESETVSPESCVQGLPFMALPCWSAALAKAAGIAMIMGAFLNKAPVVVNLIDTESTEGLSRGAVYGDLIMYANGFCYGFLQGLPFTAFGENAALLLQSIVIMMLYWKFTKGVSLNERMLAFVLIGIYGFYINNYLRPSQYYLLLAAIWPANFYSRGSQLYATYQAKHTGANSIITVGMNLIGNVIRILTTLQEVGMDIPLLSGYLIGTLLNGLCFAQFFMYWDNTQKFLQQLEDAKKPKKKPQKTRIITKKPGEKMD